MDRYYIGGSPCSGKSTIAEMLTAKYGCYYYKLDDHLFDYMGIAAENAKPRSKNYFTLHSDGIWLRTPEVQCEDEIEIYREMFDYICSDIDQIPSSRPIIAEGAGFLPELMKGMGVDANHYFCLVPTEDFQIRNYKNRPFIPYILQDCSDKELAFDLWMNRDILFAKYAAEAAGEMGYESLWIDGALTPEAVLDIVERQFLLKTPHFCE